MCSIFLHAKQHFYKARQPLNRFLFLVASVFLCAVSAGAADVERFSISQACAQLPDIMLYLDILDTEGKPAAGLAAENISATLGRDPVSTVSLKPFEETGEGIATVFLVDISKSITPTEFLQMRKALKAWVKKMTPKDRSAIVTVGESCKVISDFTDDRGGLIDKIEALAPSENKTLLHLGIARALELGKRADPGLPLRRAIVVLSDGKDEGSGMTVDDVIDRIKRDRVPIYAIGYSRLATDKQKFLDVLHRIARSSGGIYQEAATLQIEEMFTAMNSAVRRVFVCLLTCAACPAVGQVSRVQATLTAGGRVISDGIDLTLLPRPPVAAPATAMPSAPQKTAKGTTASSPTPEEPWWESLPWWGYAGVACTGILCVVLIVLVVRRRKSAALAILLEEQVHNVQQIRIVGHDKETAGGQTQVTVEKAYAEPSGPGMQLRFTVVRGRQGRKTYDITLRGKAIIGRSSDCDIALPEDDTASGHHCGLEFIQTKVIAYDLNSKNGTLLNGVSLKGRSPLADGDIVGVGDTELRVTLGERV